MANFSTHLNVAAFGGAVLSSLFAINFHFDNKTAFVCFSATVIGGILPDIDHDKSTPLKIMHFIFSNLIAFLIIYKYIDKLKIIEMVIVWIMANIAVGIMFYVFKKTTRHRGMIHSIPSAFLFWFLTSFILYKILNFDIQKSYLIGMFLFIGYIIHLVLDEIYSVDITGQRVKKSFGSALKICSRDKKINLLVYSLLFISLIILPQKIVIVNLIKGLINV